MTLTFGKHRGKTVEEVMIEEPGYIAWALNVVGATGKLQAARGEMIRLVRLFDEAPLLVSCRREGCQNRATRFSVYLGSPQPWSFCDQCEPPGPHGKVAFIDTYLGAAYYAQACCNDRKADAKTLVRAMARAKGLNW
jgi:hypothetical protein